MPNLAQLLIILGFKLSVSPWKGGHSTSLVELQSRRPLTVRIVPLSFFWLETIFYVFLGSFDNRCFLLSPEHFGILFIFGVPLECLVIFNYHVHLSFLKGQFVINFYPAVAKEGILGVCYHVVD